MSRMEKALALTLLASVVLAEADNARSIVDLTFHTDWNEGPLLAELGRLAKS
jgi:hypothetical protein